MTCQIFEVFEHQKEDLLLHWFQGQDSPAPMTILVRARESAHEITTALKQSGVDVLSLHGNQKPQLRDSTWQAFQNGEAPVLVGTHALLRILDQAHCATTVNFDLPEQKPDFEAQLQRQTKLVTFLSEAQKNSLAKWDIDFPEPAEFLTIEDFSYDRVAPKKNAKRTKTPKKGPRSKPLQNKKPKLNPKWGR